ncbi:tRNA (cytidine(34)-2'-O)-methyltransferase [Campylobacterota bacterium]|nr:tRNA (cytidine(34)-2'-O)-methyltransferase [Campylobacterota bacterium]
MFHIVLFSPKIPQNVGAIGRTCVCTGSTLSVIAPTPIEFDDKKLRRAGLDYWQYLDFRLWESLDAFTAAHPITDRHFFLTTKTSKHYFEAEFRLNDYFWFGAEDTGLPEDFWRAHTENALTIPMKKEFRSLNLANAAAIITYEAMRQNFTHYQL